MSKLNQNKKEVSDIDKKNLKTIRSSIQNLHKKYAKNYDTKNIKILDVAPEVWEGAKKYFKNALVETLDIDPESNAEYVADLGDCSIVPSKRFDIIFCTEVLEHTNEPQNCARSLKRILKDDGTIVVTTPFNLRIHNPLPDNWRFTEHGLRLLFTNAGFSRIQIEEIESDRFLMPIQYILTAMK